MGRPSEYDPVLADVICDLIADGESLRTITGGENMPHRNTIFRWISENPDFAAKYAGAREAQADLMDEKILTAADMCSPETAKADAVKIAAYQWRASKLSPKRFGTRVDHEVSGDLNVQIKIGGNANSNG